jgi:N-acetylmuramoyl-L-alanine amidase
VRVPALALSALIAIDAGHTPEAPGAIGASGMAELEYNLALAEELKRALEADGQNVRRLRQNRDVVRRTGEATGADLLVSLHHDDVKPEFRAEAGKYAGFSIFISRRNVDAAKSARCAAAIGGELRAVGLEPSRYHADPVRGENLPFADEKNGVHYYDALPLARSAGMPAVLIEAGVITNPADERRVTAPAMRKKIAGAIAHGIEACLK